MCFPDSPIVLLIASLDDKIHVLTLLLSERPKLYGVLAVLSAMIRVKPFKKLDLTDKENHFKW